MPHSLTDGSLARPIGAALYRWRSAPEPTELSPLGPEAPGSIPCRRRPGFHQPPGLCADARRVLVPFTARSSRCRPGVWKGCRRGVKRAHPRQPAPGVICRLRRSRTLCTGRMSSDLPAAVPCGHQYARHSMVDPLRGREDPGDRRISEHVHHGRYGGTRSSAGPSPRAVQGPQSPDRTGDRAGPISFGCQPGCRRGIRRHVGQSVRADRAGGASQRGG